MQLEAGTDESERATVSNDDSLTINGNIWLSKLYTRNEKKTKLYIVSYRNTVCLIKITKTYSSATTSLQRTKCYCLISRNIG